MRKTYTRKLKTYLAKMGYYSRPSFLILGAQKSGTSALYQYLSQHPNIIPPTKKEIGFFSFETFWDLHQQVPFLPKEPVHINFEDPKWRSQALAWYHSHFPFPIFLRNANVTFEATPRYLTSEHAAERIHSYDPKMKMIVILRDPVKRSFSSWNMFRNMELNVAHQFHHLGEKRDFVTAIQDEIVGWKKGVHIRPGYITRGLYYEQIKRYRDFFPKEQLLILDSHELEHRTAETLTHVIDFLCLPPHTWDRFKLAKIYTGRYTRPISDEAKHVLNTFYKPQNEKLYKLLNKDFGW